MSRRDSYIKGASTLAGGMLLAKVIGAIYRIPLTNIIGSMGIGVYQMIFPIYALLITLTGSGIPTTLSRLIAEERILGNEHKARAIFRQSCTIFLLIGLIFSLLLYLLAPVIADIQNNPYVETGYKLISPAIMLSTGIALFRGWFQGNMNMTPSAISQIVEQGVKLLLGLVFAYLLMPRGVKYAVWGAIVSISFSELIALIIIIINYYVSNKRQKELIPYKRIENDRSVYKSIFNIIIPITLGGLMFPLVQFIDSLMIVNILNNRGYDMSMSTKMYGLLAGPVGSLINMPVVLSLAFAISAIPVVSASRVKRDIEAIRNKSQMSVKMTFIICVPSSLAIYALADSVMSVLYPNLLPSEQALAAGLLKVASLSIILLAIMQIYTALLQAIDKSYTPFIIMSIGALLKIILTLLLVKYMGIYGAALSSILSYSFVALLNVIALLKWTGKYKILTKNISTILFSGVIMCIAILLVSYLLRAQPQWLTLIIGTLIGVIIYGIMLVYLRTFTEQELLNMPMSNTLLKATRLIRFWEQDNDKNNRNGNKG